MDGHIPRGSKDIKQWMAISAAVHLVQIAQQLGYPSPTPCYANKFGLCCDCFSFMNVGICSHVIACNHMMRDPADPHSFNLRSACAEICSKSKKRKAGRPAWPRPALEREA